MLFYLSLFLLFIAIYKYAERSESWFLLLIAIMIPTLFEGLRDDVVGTDMLGYGSQWFEAMDVNNSLWEVIENAPTPEYGYLFIIYICKKILPDIHLYMTACAFIKICMVYLAAYRMRHVLYSSIFLFGYYCFFYVLSFSMMRQGVAVAICIYSMTFLMNHELKKFVAWVIVAYFFHNSAVLMLLFIPLYFIRSVKYRSAIIIGVALWAYTSIEFLFSLVLNLPIFKEQMADLYEDSGVVTAKTNILISLAFLLYSIFLQIWYKKQEEKQEEDGRIFFLMASSIISLLILFLASYIEVAFRMSYYFFIMAMFLSVFFIKMNKFLKGILILAYIFLFILHFYIACSHGLNDALNYSSRILGIS